MCLYYCSPEDNKPGHAQYDHTARAVDRHLLRLPPRVQSRALSRTPPDTMTAAVGAEYVNFQCDKRPGAPTATVAR
jgi:hypothetical protein